jgi:hypothetical protein
MLAGKKLLHPTPKSTHEYEEVRASLLRTWTAIEDVVGVYEFGSVGCPGISDLDFMVVVRDTPRDLQIGVRFARLHYSARERAILAGGTIMAFPESMFRDIALWDDVTTIARYGPEVAARHFDASTQVSLEIARALDWLPERIASAIRAVRSPNIVATRLLGILYNLPVSFEKIERLGVLIAPRAATYRAEVEQLRQQWFEMGAVAQHAELERCFEAGLTLSVEYLMALHTWLLREGWYTIDEDAPSSQFVISHDFGFTFDHDWSLSDWRSRVEGGGSMMLPVPTTMRTHLLCYARCAGMISSRMRDAFSSGTDHVPLIPSSHAAILVRRMTWVNELASFLRRHQFVSGLWKFGWFYSSVQRASREA